MDINKHKFILVQLLKEIYSDMELATILGFKGGTAHMFFYDLPRFSVDLDFNLLDQTKSKFVFNAIKKIVLRHGNIRDEAIKYYGLLIVLDYGSHERNLKIEISNREYADSYEIKNYLGIPVQVMIKKDMFSHKLCALMDRNNLTNRDVFDIYYFMRDKTPVNIDLIENRMKMTYSDYVSICINKINNISNNGILNGIGELIDQDLKLFVKNKLRTEVIQLLKIYQQFPII